MCFEMLEREKMGEGFVWKRTFPGLPPAAVAVAPVPTFPATHDTHDTGSDPVCALRVLYRKVAL